MKKFYESPWYFVTVFIVVFLVMFVLDEKYSKDRNPVEEESRQMNG